VVPVKDRVLVRVHHACARLNVELRKLFPLHLLQRSCSMDRLVPASLFAADLFVSVLYAVDAESNRDVKLWTFLENACHIREYPLMDLAVRHQINRIELVVLIERTHDLGQVLSRKRFTAGENENSEIAAE